MRYFPVLFVLAAACHEPETAPTTASAVTSTGATASGPPAEDHSAKARPRGDDDHGGLSGIGEGAGIIRSSDENFDRFAHGNDPRKPTGPKVRAGELTVTGRLPPEVVKRVARQIFGKLGRCYQPLLIKEPSLSASATTSFTIDASGSVKGAKTSSAITDKPMLLCIERAFSALSFPQPEGGVVKVVFPVTFGPSEYKFTIGDKHSIQATEADVVKALEAAGCKVTGAPSTSPPSAGVSRFKAEKGYLTFSITLDPEANLPLDVYAKLVKQAATLEDGSWGLFVESSDKISSQALLDAIHKKTEKK